MPISKIPVRGTQDLFNNISDEGTEGTKVASGTTAQRGSTTGQWRYNETTGFFEGRNSDGTFSTLQPDPIVTSVDDSEVDSAGGGNQTIVVTGQNFSSGGTISFVGSSAEFNATTTTFNSSTQVTAVAPKASFLNAQEPYSVKFTASNGKTGTSATGLINVDNNPVFGVASGTLGTLSDADRAASNLTTVTATDADGEAITFSLLSGTLPTGITFNSNGTFSGTANAESSTTTYSFTIRATAGGKNVDRAYTITVASPVATGGTTSVAGGYVYHTFTSSGNFVVLTAKSMEYLLVAGGGGGGAGNSGSAWGGGGGGAGGAIDNTATLSAATYAVVIGNGGAGDTAGSSGRGASGQDSTFNSQTAVGGGGGGTRMGTETGGNGGSGGGGSGSNPGGVAGGTGTSGQGNNGGTGSFGGAGGGGKTQAGQTTPNGTSDANGGDGGTGINWKSLGTSYAGGGGGGAGDPTSGQGGNGTAGVGQAGGGNGGVTNGSTNENGYNAGANTGSGGGGAAGGAINVGTARNGGNGGSGILIIRYAA